MKIAKILTITLISILLMTIVGLEATYHYKIYGIVPAKPTSEENNTQVAKEALWVSLGESEQVQLNSYSATEYFVRFMMAAFFYDYKSFSKKLPKGASLSNLAARIYAYKNESKDLRGHLNNIVISIWVSRNYKAEEALNYILNNMYLGRGSYGMEQSAKTYFLKEPQNLTYSETISLIALSHSPSYICNIDRLTARSEVTDKRLKELNPTLYAGQEYTVPEFAGGHEYLCKKSMRDRPRFSNQPR